MPSPESLWWLLRQPYERLVRPRLPKTIAVANGVAIRSSRLFDSVLPWHTLHLPDYEGPLLEGVRSVVELGDTVIVIGGGWGVATIEAARQTGPSGTVVTYEGSADQMNRIRDTLELNAPSATVELHHAIVGSANDVYGRTGAAQRVAPGDLPAADVLVMDCEGAERVVLGNLEHTPRAIVVETHGLYGSPPNRIRALLEGYEYSVEDLGPAAPRKAEFCEENGVRVLLAKTSLG